MTTFFVSYTYKRWFIRRFEDRKFEFDPEDYDGNIVCGLKDCIRYEMQEEGKYCRSLSLISFQVL